MASVQWVAPPQPPQERAALAKEYLAQDRRHSDATVNAARAALQVLPVVGKASGSAIWAAGSYLSSYLTNNQEPNKPPAEPDDGMLRGLGSSEVLRVANTLSGIFSSVAPTDGKSLQQPELPRLVVVGTQSSGKSSLLNGFLAADILPLGESMVTRAPLSLQLVHTPDPAQMRAEFGEYVSGCWRSQTTIELACPNPTISQLDQVRAAIDAATDVRAGKQKAVSSEPIFLKIFSPNVPNLSLVDLPGLTMTALTDAGQPKNIKLQIREMISTYIKPERTIILMVCAGRTDLETDPALELVKEFDPQGVRTVGVLTKTDLMNTGTDVVRYLSNSVPTDLQLSLGYFAVRNRSPAESRGAGALTVLQGFTAEAEYFSNHSVYGKAAPAVRARCGVPLLSRFLSRVLLQHLKQHLPTIMSEVSRLTDETEMHLAELGPGVPQDEAGRSSLTQTIVASFCRDFVGSLVEKRADIKTGRKIKDAFLDLQAHLKLVTPFEATGRFSDEYLLEAARDCEGNHLSFPVPPIELLEHMLQHPEHRPIRELLAPCQVCLGAVHEELLALSNQLLQRPSIIRFPQLQARVREEVSGMLDHFRARAQSKIEEIIAMEEAYISTEDTAFLAELQSVVKRLVNRLDASLLRSLLTSYYGTVIRSVSNSIPKAIMLFMVKESELGIYTTLFDRIGRQPPVGLLDEPPEMCSRRGDSLEMLQKLRSAKVALESLH